MSVSPIETFSFLALSAVAIVGSLGLVHAKRVAHSMFYLILAFLAVAGIFLMQGAEILAAVQILVYLGSVMLVVLFGIMLTRRRIMDEGGTQ